MNRFIAWSVTLLISSAICHAQEFSSGPERTSLIELFTSEGCSSCPPADKRLNALADDKGLWKEFVPIAFHVDYWNYLGWTDPYASADYSARQRQYTKEWNARTTYTPCFVVNGVATRTPRTKTNSDRVGTLKVELRNNNATVIFTPTEKKSGYIAWIAPLSDKLSNLVKSGENRGQYLEHRFVALGLNSQMMSGASNGTYSATLAIPEDARTKAIAVWVSGKDFLKPLQATGGWLPP